MPLLTLLGGAAALAAGALGVGGHLDAQEKNEQAEQIRDMAKTSYDATKTILNLDIKITQQSLIELGTTKQKVLESSMERFIRSYEKIKEIQMSTNGEVDDLASFQFSSEDMVEIQQLDSNYESAVSTDAAEAADAAAGAALLLAAGGSIPVLAEGASMAGAMLSIGEVGTAASIAGSTVGAALTPLAAVAAPVVLFTGLAASMKADENLEQAQVMQAQAEEAMEKMETSMILCEAIVEKSKMFNELITQLNGMFDECSQKLEQTISRREAERRKYKNKKLQGRDFTRDEIKLMAVTGSLAKAMKVAIDTPMLKDDCSGELTSEAEGDFENMQAQLPAFANQVAAVEAAEPKGGYGLAPVDHSEDELDRRIVKPKEKPRKKNAVAPEKKESGIHPILKFVLWLLCVWIGFAGFCLVVAGLAVPGVLWMVAAVILCPKVKQERRFLPRIGWMLALFVISGFLS